MKIVDVQVVGVQRVIRAMRNKAVQDVIAVHEGLDKCGDVILRKAQYFCPFKTGRLRRSGRKVVNGKKGLNADVIVFFDAPHALPVHERTDQQHAAPTSARYLARAVVATRGTCVSILHRQIAVGMK